MEYEIVRIEVKRLYPNVICGRVLEMPRELRGCGVITEDGEFRITSGHGPRIGAVRLCLWGDNQLLDNRAFGWAFDCSREADEWLAVMRTMIRNINQQLPTEDASPTEACVTEILE